MKALAAIVLLGLPLAGCTTVITLGAPAASDAGSAALPEAGACVPVAAGTAVRSTLHARLTRSYEVTVPAGVDTCARPRALFVFHGRGADTSEGGERKSMILEAAARAGALAVLVQGSVAGGRTGWACSGCTTYDAADDVGLVRAIASELGIDLTRSTALGVDEGGSFVHRLVAELPLPAGAVFGGALGNSPTGSKATLVRPTVVAPATMFLEHGENDDVMPFEGGDNAYGGFVTRFTDATAFWRQANDCEPKTVPQITLTSASETQIVECNGSKIVAVKWVKTKHALPLADPENAAVGFEAVVAQLLAR